ncbi:MAG: HAMP domain-containing protein [Gammaproteobacteria bacterium]|nr:HAMP domain-containing protein [Gammaproteobacteria bacterium]
MTSWLSLPSWLHWWRSLRARLLLIFLTVMVSFYSWVDHNVASVLKDVALEHANTSIHLTSETLNLAITPHTTISGIRGLSDYFNELLVDDGSGLVYIGLYDEHGLLLAGAGLEGYDEQAANLPMQEQMAQGLVHVRQPILILNNQVGELRYGLSLLAFDQNVQRIHQNNLWVLFLAVLLLALALLSVFVRLNQRFSRLMKTSQALAQGDYQVRAELQGDDELTLLAQHFNSMADAVASRIQALESSQAKIEQLNTELEQRVLERTQTLTDTLTALEDAQQHLIQSEKLASLGALVAGVSHELNTPVGNALTVATTLADKNKAFNALLVAGNLRKSSLETYVDNVQEAQLLISRNLRRAADLIHSFKQVSVDQTSYQRRSFNLSSMVDEVMMTIQPMLRPTKVSVELDIDPRLNLTGYPGPLGQVITNLVANALTHAFDETSLLPSIRIVAKLSYGDDWVSLVVEDNGKGIAPEYLKKVFDPFFTTRLGKGGSGLGLHIVHNLITGMLGGKILVESALDQGTRFMMKFPMTTPVSRSIENAM